MNDIINLEQIRRYNRVVRSWFTFTDGSKNDSLENVQKSALRIVMRYLNLTPTEVDQNQFFKMLERIGPQNSEALFSESQIHSKVWLGKTLIELKCNELDNVAILGGWYGHHPLFLRHCGVNYKQVVSFDKDSTCISDADFLNGPDLEQEFRFKAVTGDVFSLNLENYLLSLPNGNERELVFQTVICTSCEHLDLPKLLKLVPSGVLVALQGSDNKDYVGHDFAYRDLDDFKEKCNLSTLHYSGEISLGPDKRFMVVGRK